MNDRLIKWHRSAVIACAVVAMASAVLLLTRGLKRDYSLEAFVASESDAYVTFRRVMDEFLSNELAVVAIQGDGATSETTLKLVGAMSAEFRRLPAVQRVTSLGDLLNDIPAFLRSTIVPRLRDHPLFADNLISRDGRSTAIILQMAGEGRTGPVRKQTVATMKSIVARFRADHPDHRIMLAGPYVTLIDMYDYVDRDLLAFSAAALALLVVTLGLVFRRVAPMLFALGVSVAATLTTLGFASVFDLPATLITQMIVILVTVLSVANCVHLAVADDEVFVRTPFQDWRERARRVLGRMAAPCSAVMVTTAVGFGSVSISSITPVRMFGLLMVLGLMLALGMSVIAVPLLARLRLPASSADRPVLLPRLLQNLAQWVGARRGRVILGFCLVSLGFAAALPWLRFESDFVKNFRPGSEVRRSYEFIESNLTPAGSIEVVVRRADGGAILSPDLLARLRDAGDRVVSRFEPIKKAMTLADLLSVGGDRVPSTGLEMEARLALARRLLGNDALRNFVNADGSATRLNLRAAEGVPVHEKLRMAREIDSVVAEALGPRYATEVTGLYVFYATLVAELWRDQFRSLAMTAPAVLIVLVFVLRSIPVALVAMVPTALPIVFCLGAMAWTGIPVNMTTAMMLSVTMGIAVDDAVHYLWRYRTALDESGDEHRALRIAHGSVGRACVFTTVVIAGGFWILMLSRFLPTAYFGGLLGFTMCGALAGNLLLLPALVLTLKPFGRRSSR